MSRGTRLTTKDLAAMTVVTAEAVEKHKKKKDKICCYKHWLK
jgi:hypothetical protein